MSYYLVKNDKDEVCEIGGEATSEVYIDAWKDAEDIFGWYEKHKSMMCDNSGNLLCDAISVSEYQIFIPRTAFGFVWLMTEFDSDAERRAQWRALRSELINDFNDPMIVHGTAFHNSVGGETVAASCIPESVKHDSVAYVKRISGVTVGYGFRQVVSFFVIDALLSHPWLNTEKEWKWIDENKSLLKSEQLSLGLGQTFDVFRNPKHYLRTYEWEIKSGAKYRKSILKILPYLTDRILKTRETIELDPSLSNLIIDWNKKSKKDTYALIRGLEKNGVELSNKPTLLNSEVQKIKLQLNINAERKTLLSLVKKMGKKTTKEQNANNVL